MSVRKPFLIFAIFALVVFLFGNYVEGNIDIDFNNTYIVLSKYIAGVITSIYLLMIGIIYFIVQKSAIELSKVLNLSHLLITVGGLSLIFILKEFDQNLDIIIYPVAMIMIFSQIILPVNILKGVRKRRA